MEKHTHKDCIQALKPVQDTLDVINGKWKLQIIISLNAGNKRFTEIERSIPKLTSKVLAKELKELEQNNLVERVVKDTYPVSIEYLPTEHTKTLFPVVESLKHWGENHRKHIFGAPTKVEKNE
ncbi:MULTISPECIES: helix-turn-helix domain-containing protein [Chryseobacterium]|jgi:DNA-binding HxlR family transcriptional regulator|uniref:DNA-binding HxlR family transcriptional regulator n=1 Tax=Chryseobacterium geocarposphaerae TaxID=1416776 RepID=A0ABU1L9F7_9FLAO|nr:MULTISPECIES: helix-turn-helix domain-containing protein [Chryseobacterium]MDR6403354.1 DNA-binding HxlR family transcriptional regulator [Chryseobacterium geocarposphaerae]MDR6696908.1 DNA-binding HxlR family transcriptional regulator [Chryseobacterium ginsenosidimutans]